MGGSKGSWGPGGGFAKGLVKDVRQQSTEILKSVKDADWAQDLKEFGDELAD